jgi:hypothetical protein
VREFINHFNVWFRVFIILALIIATWLTFSSFGGTFWPADMVPHPHTPGAPKPEAPGKPTPCRR